MLFISVMSDSETAMASTPRNPCSYVSDSLLPPLAPPPPPSSPSSLPQTNTKSIDHVWNHMIKLPSLSYCSFDISKDRSTTITDSSPSTFFSTLFHKHDDNNHSSLSASNIIKKRGQQDIYDGRHKRMIKNRESAVRSRARKKAYNYGLEINIERLREENSRLRRQLEQLQAKANPPALYRTSTCPF